MKTGPQWAATAEITPLPGTTRATDVGVTHKSSGPEYSWSCEASVFALLSQKLVPLGGVTTSAFREAPTRTSNVFMSDPGWSLAPLRVDFLEEWSTLVFGAVAGRRLLC